MGESFDNESFVGPELGKVKTAGVDAILTAVHVRSKL